MATALCLCLWFPLPAPGRGLGGGVMPHLQLRETPELGSVLRALADHLEGCAGVAHLYLVAGAERSRALDALPVDVGAVAAV